MEIIFAGKGPVGIGCLALLEKHGLSYSAMREDEQVPPCDLLLSVHWPRIFTKEELDRCKIGALNLHNSFLPWNRGADACAWAIIDQTPHGATVHWIDKGIDSGDIFLQAQMVVPPDCTTDSLYKLTAHHEIEVFDQALQLIKRGRFPAVKQVGAGSYHRKSDFERILRAATTNKTKVLSKVSIEA